MDDQQTRIAATAAFFASLPFIRMFWRKIFPDGFWYVVGRSIGRASKQPKVSRRQGS